MNQGDSFSFVSLIATGIIRQMCQEQTDCMDVGKHALLYDRTKGSGNKNVESEVGVVGDIYIFAFTSKRCKQDSHSLSASNAMLPTRTMNLKWNVDLIP